MAIERNITISILILIFGFIITWLPYALVSMYTAFIDPEGLDPMFGTLSSIFAKSSMFWPAFLYIFTNEKIKKKIFMDNHSQSMLHNHLNAATLQQLNLIQSPQNNNNNNNNNSNNYNSNNCPNSTSQNLARRENINFFLLVVLLIFLTLLLSLLLLLL
jgi:hypothetical protein